MTARMSCSSQAKSMRVLSPSPTSWVSNAHRVALISNSREGLEVTVLSAEHSGVIVVLLTRSQCRVPQNARDDSHLFGRFFSDEGCAAASEQMRVDWSAEQAFGADRHSVVDRVLDHRRRADRDPEPWTISSSE